MAAGIGEARASLPQLRRWGATPPRHAATHTCHGGAAHDHTMPLPRRLGTAPSADRKPFLGGRRGLPKELQIPGDLSMSHKLLVEAFAAQNPPTSYRAELPRKLEVWLVPQVRRGTGVPSTGLRVGACGRAALSC